MMRTISAQANASIAATCFQGQDIAIPPRWNMCMPSKQSIPHDRQDKTNDRKVKRRVIQ